MTLTETIGFVAAFCTTISFLPQAIKVISTRDTASLSLLMYIVFTVGVSLWLVYGVLQGDAALVMANFVTLLFALIILGTKIYTEYLSPRAKQAQRGEDVR